MIKQLNENETDLIKQIDRAENINSSYCVRHGELLKYQHKRIAGGWDAIELKDIIDRSSKMILQKGIVLGYFNEDKIIGVASLDAQKLKSPNNFLLMDVLYISRQFRGKGIGNELFEAIKAEAVILEASGIYISATPTSGAVEFYLSRGCELANPNQALFKKEPEDIHLQYNI